MPSSAAPVCRKRPLYAIKKVDDITASGRTPYCWVYTNQVTGLMSGYKLAVFNNEVVQPAVLAITAAGKAATDAGAVALKTLPPAEQKAVLDQLQRSKCFGTAAGVEAAIAKAEGLCGNVEDVAPQATVGQQGLIAKAVFAWEEQSWAGAVTRESAALGVSLKGLAGRSEKCTRRASWWFQPRPPASALACICTPACRMPPPRRPLPPSRA